MVCVSRLHAVDLTEANLDVRGVPELYADGHRDVGWIESSRCHLIEQRLEEMMVAMIDQDDLKAVFVRERFRGVQSREAGADDHYDLGHCDRLRATSYQLGNALDPH